MSFTFGVFVAPFHPPTESPTVALERDLELAEMLDRLDIDEIWVGEHHSGGWGTIASPEVFIAAAAERTQRIRLGTGVVSLPYHHPMHVASRIVLLDHLTRGRVTLGVGAGSLPSDACMLGIDPAARRRMMEESLAAIVHLLTDPEPLTASTDWFALRDATLQLRPYSPGGIPLAVASSASPSGMRLAGRYGAMPLSLAAFYPGGLEALPQQWDYAAEAAAEAGRELDRSAWRLVIPLHLAESREQALRDVRAGGLLLLRDYFKGTLGLPVHFEHPNPDADELEAMIAIGAAIVGTPDDCVEGIARLQEVTGGFGGILAVSADWAPRERIRESFELLARHVVPRLRGSTLSLERSQRSVAERRDELMAMTQPVAR
ncbi:MAG: limonene 1,2-monooxygenase [Thermoleophilaceae bacterium]|jgi:limonene 1,2-monooxygenase|nr:limonene 1,2-monooxygenase [Thermoleophilaceae bacterium]